ncbi:hypothetical protein P261_00635 [Lachnospiraceae bacterium TWA4]|nr:hypothetical protein P261_00635 [Lachnospiraceae bacterium TWA4]
MIESAKISLNFVKKEPFTGSYKGMRYRLHKGEDEIVTTVWPEPFCYEKTADELKTVKKFELTPEGKEEAVKWLNEEYESHFVRKL